MSTPDALKKTLLAAKSIGQSAIESGGITTAAKEPDAARALIKHLTIPEALAIYKAKGLGL